MKKTLLFGLLLWANFSFSQNTEKKETVYRYLHLPADSANQLLFQNEKGSPNFLLDVRNLVLNDRINLYSEDADAYFVYPTALPAVEYVIDELTGQAQKEIKRISYFETETDERLPVPNNQDVYEFVMRPIVASELKEIRVLEKGTWNKKTASYEFEPEFIGFVRLTYNDLFRNMVWVSLEELSSLEVKNKNWMKFFKSKSYEGFQYKQFGFEPVFGKDECIQAKWRIIERSEANALLFNDENPSYSFLGLICRMVEDGQLNMETSNPIRYSQNAKDEVFMTRRSDVPMVDETGEPYTVVNDEGVEVYIYPYDAELFLSTGKLKYIKVREEGGLTQTVHFVFDEEGKEIEYFSISMNELTEVGPMVTNQDWYTFIRLMKYKANTIRQSSCADPKIRR